MLLNRGKIKKIKSILETNNFYPFLCAYSNNDIDLTITNLSKVINYILMEDNIPNDLEELLNNATSYNKKQDYLILATNSYLDNEIRIRGISSHVRNNKLNQELLKLDHNISFLDFDTSPFFPLYGTIEEAIKEGFSHPKRLYKSILKQPTNNQKPMVVGETETNYYSSILERRLQNVPEIFHKTSANVASRVLKEIIGKNITLYFLPTDKELGEKELSEDISPFALRSISIPSRYTLLTIIAKNKKLANGTELSIDTGTNYERREEEQPKKYSSLSYHRYEVINVDDKFVYDNSELSGDALYDIDQIYGCLDTRNSREILSSIPLQEKLESIKKTYDISAILRNGKYKISNGRHRLLFLKYYYLSNCDYCNKDEYLKKYLIDSTSVVARIDHTIEDEEIQKYLIYLEKKHHPITYLKTNINNDDLDILILHQDKTYHIKNKKELLELINLFDNNILNNNYYIGYNAPECAIPPEVIVAKAVTLLKENIVNMDYINFLRFINNNNIIIGDVKITPQMINHYDLYNHFVGILHVAKLNELKATSIDYVERAYSIIDNYLNNKKISK